MSVESTHQFREGQRFTLHSFIYDSRSVGIILLACTIFSLIVTNIPALGSFYHNFWKMDIPFFHHFHLPHSVLHFINDALMAIFFFQVGMEIKREAIVGELSSRSRMLVPIVAALSGVLFPALIFFIVNKGTPYMNGWAIPTATDIAFSLGLLSLLGKAVPHSMRVFLTALAIIDDLIAILVIALFYASNLSLIWLLGVMASIAVIFLIIRYLKTRFGKFLALAFGFVLWYCMYRSGIHATFAGVLIAMLLPVERIPVYEKRAHIPVNFFILPLFALANTSILISSSAVASLVSTLSLGIVFGLFIGKPTGITLAVLLLARGKIIKLQSTSKLMQFIGVGILAGIGFTMSIFVSTLAFSDDALQDTAKLSVLIASFVSMFVGYIWLKLTFKNMKPEKTSRGETKKRY